MENRGNGIRERVQAYMNETGKNIAETAREAGISRPALSRYMSDTYDGSVQNVEEALSEFLTRLYGYRAGVEAAQGLPRKPEYLETLDATSIENVCRNCQDFAELGMVVGWPGFGKTYALRHYARQKRTAYIECDDTMSLSDLVKAIHSALGIAGAGGSIWTRTNAIKDYFNRNKGWLLIIDEADKLVSRNTQKKMELLRGIYDQSCVGIVLTGEPTLETRVKTYLPRTANRVGFFLRLGGLTGEEVERFLEPFDVEPNAMKALKLRATNERNGCFRLLDRTLNNIIRYMNDNRETRITADIVEEMSRMSLY